VRRNKSKKPLIHFAGVVRFPFAGSKWGGQLEEGKEVKLCAKELFATYSGRYKEKISVQEKPIESSLD